VANPDELPLFARMTIQVRRFFPTRMPNAGVVSSKYFPAGSVRTVWSVKRKLGPKSLLLSPGSQVVPRFETVHRTATIVRKGLIIKDK
jgi:hypothetical protein